MIRTIAQFFIKSKGGKKPLPKTRKIVALAIQALFPELYPNVNVLLPSNSNYGAFGKALTNAVTSYKKYKKRVANEVVAEIPMEIEEDQETNESLEENNNDENGNAHIRYLKTVTGSKNELSRIKIALRETQNIRQESYKTGKTEFIFDLYFTNPYFIKYDCNLLYPESQNLEADEINNLRAFCLKEQVKKVKKFKIKEEIDLFEAIIHLCGKTKGGKSKASEMLYHTCNENIGLEALKQLATTRSQPFIIIRESSPIQYLVAFDSKILALNPRKYQTFGKAFNVLFKMFYLFNIKFPEELKKFYTFFAIGIYKVPAEIGRSYVLLDLLHCYSKFLQTFNEDDTSENGEDESTQSD